MGNIKVIQEKMMQRIDAYKRGLGTRYGLKLGVGQEFWDGVTEDNALEREELVIRVLNVMAGK